MSFCSATLIDGDDTIVLRGLRVVEEFQGEGFFRMLLKYVEEWARARNIYRKVTVVSEKQLANMTKPSLTKWNKVLTKVLFRILVDIIILNKR